jgi:hypothetical protein
MLHAKKLVLVEPRVLEQLQTHREYKELQKDSDTKTKATMSLELQNLLADSSIGDDIKAKLYQQSFTKFQNLRDSIPENDIVQINPLSTPVKQRARVQQQQQSTPKRRRKTNTTGWTQY